MEEFEKELERELEARKVEAQRYPPFVKFETVGQKVIGELLMRRSIPTPDGEERETWIIKTKDGDFTLPSLKVLDGFLKNCTEGDYVMIEYVGEGKGKRGNPPKLFNFARLTKDEAERIRQRLEGKPKARPRPEEKPKEEEKPKPKVEEKPKESEEKKIPEEEEKKMPEEEKREEKPALADIKKDLKYFVDTLLKWYGKIEVEQLEKRMNRVEKFAGLTAEDVVAVHDGVEIVEDGGKKFLKTKG
jgi:hypothetical protein